jgi:hypothetical protein
MIITKAPKHTETEGSGQQQYIKRHKYIQSLSIFIISSFTTTPLTLSYSSIFWHSLSSVPVEGEYRPSLKDCLIMSVSSSEAPTSTSNKTLLPLIFADPRP